MSEEYRGTAGAETQAAAGEGEEVEEVEEKTSLLRWLIETAVLVALAFGLSLLIRYFLVEPYRVPSGSMLPTIQLQDRLLANKLVFKVGGKPQYKDVVVFADPTGEYPNLVKRVIATEGQVVDLTEDGQVTVDGLALDEPYTHGQRSDPLFSTSSVAFPFTVPKDHVWVMGDNRENSADSRVFGAVPLKDVRGRVFLTYWPLNHFGRLDYAPKYGL
ncbi:MAG: signal peptidase I [Actinomycetes bacterium]|jgi:signal peptidase I|nr:signal peptidase I [Actinomycetes bacterium]